MKQRPRRVEREIAKRITLVSEIVGADAVLRIPANGRTGPDIEINQLGLVMDVKSRESISKKMMVTKPTIFNQDFFGLPLRDFPALLEDTDFRSEPFFSLQVLGWFNHMEGWRLKNYPAGITAILLHKPKEPIGSAVFIIKEREKLIERWHTLKNARR